MLDDALDTRHSMNVEKDKEQSYKILLLKQWYLVTENASKITCRTSKSHLKVILHQQIFRSQLTATDLNSDLFSQAPPTRLLQANNVKLT